MFWDAFDIAYVRIVAMKMGMLRIFDTIILVLSEYFGLIGNSTTVMADNIFVNYFSMCFLERMEVIRASSIGLVFPCACLYQHMWFCI